MKPNRLLLVAMLAFTPVASLAQISFSQAELLGLLTFSGTTTTFETEPSAALAALAAAEGAGRTWDFSALAYGPGVVAETGTVPISEALGSDDPHFAGADVVVRTTEVESDSSVYAFFDIAEGGIDFLGLTAIGEDEEGQPGIVGIKYLPASRIYAAPLAFGTAWTDEHEVEFIPWIEELILEAREESGVVGWGTLVTPSGSAEALMVRTKTVQTLSVYSPELDTMFVVGMDSLYTINFLSKENLSAGISLDGLGNVVTGSYGVATGGTAADPGAPAESALRVSVYPSPVPGGGEAVVSVSLAASERVRVEVYDLLGRRVATLVDGVRAAGEGEVRWSPRGVPAGLYLVRAEAGAQTVTRRVTVLH